MAKPIKETPVLRGREAVKFYREVKANEGKKVASERIDRGKFLCSKIEAKAK